MDELSQAESLLSQLLLNSDDPIANADVELLHCCLLLRQEEYAEALKLVDTVLSVYEKHQTSEIHYAEAISYKAFALWKLGYPEDFKKYLVNAERLRDRADPDLQEWKGMLYFIRGTLALTIDDDVSAEKNYLLALDHYKPLKRSDYVARIYNNMAVLYRKQGDYDKAIAYLEQSLRYWEQLNHLENIAMTNNNIGGLFFQVTNYDLALQFYQAALESRNQIGDPNQIAQTLHNIGTIYAKKGQLDQAIEYFSKSLKLREDIHDQEGIAWSLKVLGDVYIEKGELDKSLENFIHCLLIREKIGKSHEIAQSLADLGVVYYLLGEDDLAFSHYKRSLEEFQKIDNYNWSSEVLFNMVLLNPEENGMYYTILESLADSTESEVIKLRAKLAQATIMKHQNRITDKMHAQQIFEQVSKDPIVEYRLYIYSLINLADLLLLEYKATDNESILPQVRDLFTLMDDIALEQQSYTLHIELLILESRMALLEKDINAALDKLEFANDTAKERGLTHLINRIKVEQTTLLSQLHIWNQLVEANASHLERLENTEIMDYLDTIAKTLYRSG